MSRLATAVDVIVPNVFVKFGDSDDPLRQTIARTTDVVRKSQLFCEGDVARCPGLLEDPQPGDCEDPDVPGYCWRPKATSPMIQIGPNKSNDRNIWDYELEVMSVQALSRGATGLIYAKAKDAMAGPGSGCNLNCSGWQARPECVGVNGGTCPQWRLLDPQYRQCWEALDDGCALSKVAELWDNLPVVMNRLQLLFEEILSGLPAAGTEREWLIETEAGKANIEATYVSAAPPEAPIPHNAKERLLWGDYVLWGEDVPPLDDEDIVARTLIRFDLASTGLDPTDLYKAELTLPTSGRTCDGTDPEDIGDPEGQCYGSQSEQVVVARIPDGVPWDEAVTWDLFKPAWEDHVVFGDVVVPMNHVSSSFRPLRHAQQPIVEVDPQIIVLDVTDVVTDWLSGAETNNGFIVTQYDGIWGFPMGVVSNSERLDEPWNPRVWPNLRLYRMPGETPVRPLPVALEADNERVEMRVVKQSCSFDYAHVLLSHDEKLFECGTPRLRVALPQPPNKPPQLWSLDGEKIDDLAFNDADDCDNLGGNQICGSICVDGVDPLVYRIDVPMESNGLYSAIVAIPRMGL